MARGQAKPAAKPNLTYAEAKDRGLTLNYDVRYSFQGNEITPLKGRETLLLSNAGGVDAFRSQEWWEQQLEQDLNWVNSQTFKASPTAEDRTSDVRKQAISNLKQRTEQELQRSQRDVARSQLATRRLFRGTGGLLSGGQSGTIAKEPTIGAIEKPMLSTSGKLAMEAPLGAKRGLK